MSLRRADFRGATFGHRTSFETTDLRCADFRGARVVGGANFTNANLQFADLRGANLSNTYFGGASLRYARVDANTVLPAPTPFHPNLCNEGGCIADVAYIIDESGGEVLRRAGIPPSYFDRRERIPMPDCAQSP